MVKFPFHSANQIVASDCGQYIGSTPTKQLKRQHHRFEQFHLKKRKLCTLNSAVEIKCLFFSAMMQSDQGNTCMIDLAFWDFNNGTIMFYSVSYVACCQGRSTSGEKYVQFFGSDIVPAIEVSEGSVEA